MRALAFAFSALFAFGVAPGSAENLVIPEELNEAAEANGCSQIADFYRRPGMVKPAHIYGYVSRDEWNSAVFWCKKKGPSESPYVLLFVFKNADAKHELAKCARRIDWADYPGGLSIYRDRKATLDQFRYLDNRDKRGPKGVRMRYNALMSEYDGVGVVFYCFRGEWLIMGID